MANPRRLVGETVSVSLGTSLKNEPFDLLQPLEWGMFITPPAPKIAPTAVCKENAMINDHCRYQKRV